MSTPMALPLEPIFVEARKMSKPAPLPRSMTVSPSLRLVMASGLPQLRPRLASSGMLDNSSSLYPNDLATLSAYFGAAVREALL